MFNKSLVTLTFSATEGVCIWLDQMVSVEQADEMIKISRATDVRLPSA